MKSIPSPVFTQLISGRLLSIKDSLIGYCCLLFLLAVNTASAAPFAYLNAGNSVAVVDVETLTEVERIDVGRNLSYLDVRPGGSYLYGIMGRTVIGDTTDREITVIDASSHTVTATFEVPVHDSVNAYLTLVTSSPDGQRIYAVDSENYLYFIDAQTHSILHTIKVANPETLDGDAVDIDVLPDNSVVMVAMDDRAIFRFYDTQSFASLGGGNFPFFHTGKAGRSIRANPDPSAAIGGPHRHLYHACGTNTDDPDMSGCIVSSVAFDEETGTYGTADVLRTYDHVPSTNSARAKLAFSYDGQLAFINAGGGNSDDRYAAIRVVQANHPVYMGNIEFPINNTEPLNLDAHPSKHELFVYTGKADLYKATYERSSGFPSTQESVHISGGGIASGHFVGGPMPLIASIQPGSVRFPHLPVNPSSQQVFRFQNHLNIKPVSLQCSLDTEQAFAIDGGDINITVQPDETIEFTVNFSTTVAGQYTDTLRCSDSNNGEFMYSLEGYYVTPVTATPASGSNIVLPTQWPATGTTQQTINFQNNNVTNANLSCSINESTGEFSAATSLVVPANGNANLVVQFNSVNAGLFTGTLNCASDVGGSFTYYLSGETITPLEVQPIWPSPIGTVLEMGYVYPLQSEIQRTISLNNVSPSSIGLSCELTSGDIGFTLESIPDRVAAGGAVDVTVTYRSNSATLDALARLDCEDETGQQLTYFFQASALMPIDATPAKNSDVILPQQRVGTTPTSAAFTLSNPENVIDGLRFSCTTHMLTPPFTSTTNATFGLLPPGGEESFNVEFDSTTAGDFSTTLLCWVLHSDIGEGLTEEFEYTLKASAFYALTSSPPSGSTIPLPQFTVESDMTKAGGGVRASSRTVDFQNHASVDESLSCNLDDGTVFSSSPTPITIPANSSTTLTITASSTTPGDYTDTLLCLGSSGDEFSFTLTAEGVEAPITVAVPLFDLKGFVLLAFSIMAIGMIFIRRYSFNSGQSAG